MCQQSNKDPYRDKLKSSILLDVFLLQEKLSIIHLICIRGRVIMVTIINVVSIIQKSVKKVVASINNYNSTTLTTTTTVTTPGGLQGVRLTKMIVRIIILL